MYYAEIDENGRCFHVTNDKLPLSDTIIEVKNIDVLGMIWNGTDWKQESKSEEMIHMVLYKNKFHNSSSKNRRNLLLGTLWQDG